MGWGGGVLYQGHLHLPSARLSPEHPPCILLVSLGREKELAFTVVPRCTHDYTVHLSGGSQ